MPSLRDLLAAHAPVLLVDTAGSTVHVGWLSGDTAPRWAAMDTEAGSGLFEALEQVGAPIESANAFVFCDGPGSILGIRTSAVAIRTWQVLRARPAFAYRSLELLAHASGRPGLTVIADARRQHWHALTIDSAGRPGPMTRVPPDALRTPLAMPDGFRHWTPLPAVPVEPLPYDVPQLWARCIDSPLLREVSEPEAFLHEAPHYATWTPHVHQADTRT